VGIRGDSVVVSSGINESHRFARYETCEPSAHRHPSTSWQTVPWWRPQDTDYRADSSRSASRMEKRGSQGHVIGGIGRAETLMPWASSSMALVATARAGLMVSRESHGEFAGACFWSVFAALFAGKIGGWSADKTGPRPQSIDCRRRCCLRSLGRLSYRKFNFALMRTTSTETLAERTNRPAFEPRK